MNKIKIAYNPQLSCATFIDPIKQLKDSFSVREDIKKNSKKEILKKIKIFEKDTEDGDFDSFTISGLFELLKEIKKYINKSGVNNE